MALDTTVSHDLDSGVTTVEAVGELSLDSAGALRTTLGKAMSECPTAVIVDVSRCRRTSVAALAVFDASARAGWDAPVVPLLLCGAPDEFLSHARALLRGVACYVTHGAAMLAATTGATALSRRFDAPGSEAAPGWAREMMAGLCREWGMEGVRDRAVLIVSELVTNVVVHARDDVRMEILLRGDFLLIRVRDGSAAPPVRTPDGGADAERRAHGRGLGLVDRCSASWGFHLDRAGQGKVVWASVRVQPIRTARP